MGKESTVCLGKYILSRKCGQSNVVCLRMEWDGVTGNSEGRDSGTMGYCPHVSPIFATWHRPYLALFEVS